MTRLESKPVPAAVLPAQHVQVAADPQPIPVPTGGAVSATTAAGAVTLIRNGDAIVGVEVTCSCGQRIRLAFT